MKIIRLKTKNYRSLEDLDVEFNPYYNALSGKNNCGKSNIIKAVLTFLSYDYRIYKEPYSKFINYKSDFPYWKKQPIKEAKEEIVVRLELELDQKNDAGLFKFIKELIFKGEGGFDKPKEILTLIATHKPDYTDSKIKITFGEHEIKDEYKRDELINRLLNSKSVLFHNSTESNPFLYIRRSTEAVASFLNEEDKKVISDRKKSLEQAVKKSLKKHQVDFGDILGRLKEKYDVSLGIPSLELERQSIEISLKEKGIEISLDDWGSGTKNRTLILLHLLNAKRLQESSIVNERITPIVIIEEPESFLHPSAQAEFGRILQDLAKEFEIQIIVATHSPYLLSHKSPKANILLERNINLNQKGSKVINTDGEKWYEPFALSLGISGDDFGPLKSTIFSDTNDIILVEGESDKRYLELLKDVKHENNKLNFQGEIFPYGGAGNIKNNILLRFVKEKFKRFVVTVDLDKYPDVKKSFEILNLKENVEYVTIGKNETGKRCIEGLIPNELLAKVYSNNPELIQKITENSDEGKSAKNVLKQVVLDSFIEESKNHVSYFDEFYKLTKILNKIFKN